MRRILSTLVLLSVILLGMSDTIYANTIDQEILSINPGGEVTNILENGADHEGAAHAEGHHDPYSEMFLFFFAIILTAIVGRFIAKKLNQSPVLGELMLGIVVGSLLYAMHRPISVVLRHQNDIATVVDAVIKDGMSIKEAVAHFDAHSELDEKRKQTLIEILKRPNIRQYLLLADDTLLLSGLGVLLLLFMVGLESSYEEMMEVGGAALLVAILGVVFPFALGYGVMTLMMPDPEDHNVILFVSATLVATSIGITARVFKDMKALNLGEAKIVLGASVIDDIMGLIVLAIVSGIVTTGTIDPVEVGSIILKAALYLVGVLMFGKHLLKRNIRFFAKLDSSFIGLLYPFGLLMVLSYLADLIGLASIVGAFAAGLILREEYFEDLPEEARHKNSVREILAPIEGIFAPVFFVIIGFQVDVSTFVDPEVLIMGLVLSVVAIIGKLGSSIFLKNQDKMIVGVGLVPRGEVGLIFASIGSALGVLDAQMFSVIIIVVMMTTLVTPPALQWAVKRKYPRLNAPVPSDSD